MTLPITKKKTVKGWAIVNTKPIVPRVKIRISKNDPPLSEPCIWGESGGWGAMQIFATEIEAQREVHKDTNFDEVSRGHTRIIPCTITYTLIKKNKKIGV